MTRIRKRSFLFRCPYPSCPFGSHAGAHPLGTRLIISLSHSLPLSPSRDPSLPLPFPPSLVYRLQVLSTRKRKDVAVGDIDVQVCVFAFDCLYINGRSLLREPLEERRKALYGALDEVADLLAVA